MRSLTVLKQAFVIRVKFLFRLFFVREHFHDFLPFHHFFDEPLFLGKRGLLRHHIFRAVSADFFDDEGHGERADAHHEREPKAVSEHERYRRYSQKLPTSSAEQVWVYVALDMAVNLQADAHAHRLQPIDEKIQELNQLIINTLQNNTSKD